MISDKALEQVRKVAPGAQRVGAKDPVENAITFARYVERKLRLGRQRPWAWIRDRERRPAAGRRGGRAAVRQRQLGAAADHG